MNSRPGTRKRWLSLVMCVLILAGMLAVPATASADPATWRGDYYANMALFGGPTVVRYDPAVNFDWGTGAPAAGIPADQFSVNWTTVEYFNAGTYTFYVTVDDGVRVWIDGVLIIDQWKDQSATTYSSVRYLNAGNHALQVQYYENGGNALCRFWWTAGGGGTPSGAWSGEYFNNIFLAGPPTMVRTDSAVNFDWGYMSPGDAIGAENFSVRWTTVAYFANTQTYTFSATVDDGVRVYVDGALVIDRWYPQSRTTHTGTAYLNAGNHTVVVEYFEQGGVAVCQVSWTGGGWTPPPPPGGGVIVDDLSAGFIWGGPAGGMRGRSFGYNGHLYWSWNQTGQLYSWGKWFPYLTTPGNYEVSVYIPSKYHGTKSAKYVIYHNGTSHAKWVNQNNYYDQWVSLGTYYFAGGAGEYVYLGDVTGEPYMTRYVGWDAVRFVPAGGAPPEPPPPPSGCAIAPVLGFGNVWNGHADVRSGLGCPTEPEVGTWAGAQTFLGGYMFWRQDKGQIYALLNNGTWYAYADTWNPSIPETDPGIVPPPGYLQPKRGFGKVWRENPAIRSGLSWATIEEFGFSGTAQQYTGGLMFWSPHYGVFVLYNNGHWARY
ncbi:MAG: PA14 domain-containing protein [Anaerolineales bacterium]